MGSNKTFLIYLILKLLVLTFFLFFRIDFLRIDFKSWHLTLNVVSDTEVAKGPSSLLGFFTGCLGAKATKVTRLQMLVFIQIREPCQLFWKLGLWPICWPASSDFRLFPPCATSCPSVQVISHHHLLLPISAASMSPAALMFNDFWNIFSTPAANMKPAVLPRGHRELYLGWQTQPPSSCLNRPQQHRLVHCSRMRASKLTDSAAQPRLRAVEVKKTWKKKPPWNSTPV